MSSPKNGVTREPSFQTRTLPGSGGLAVLVLAGIMIGVLLLLGDGAAYWWVMTERVRVNAVIEAELAVAERQRAVAAARLAEAEVTAARGAELVTSATAEGARKAATSGDAVEERK